MTEYIIKEPFWESFPEQIASLIRRMDKFGSKYVCNPAPLGCDEDWLILATNVTELCETLHKDGYAYDGNGSDYGIFTSMRKGELNLVVTDNEDFYKASTRATEFCNEFNIKDKTDRMEVHHIARRALGVMYSKEDSHAPRP